MIAPETRPIPPLKGGAVQLYIQEVMNRLAKKHRITLISPAFKGLPRQERRGRVRIIRVKKRRYIKQVTRKLRKSRYRIVHIFNRPDYVSAIKRAAPRSKVIVNLHNDPYTRLKGKRKHRRFARKDVKKVHFFIANSKFTRKQTIRRYKKARKKTKTVYLGVNPKEFIMKWDHPRRVKKLKRKWKVSGKKVVLFVGRIDKDKGLKTLIRAAARVRRRHKNMLLLVVGGADHGRKKKDRYFRRIERWAKRKLGRHVRFTGFVPTKKIPQLYAVADVFVCPSSWKEPFGRVNIEAMATGLPVVSTNRGGIPEVVRHGKTGYLVRKSNSKLMAKYVNRLLKNRKLNKRMGRRGRKLVLKKFTWRRVANQVHSIYRKA